MMTIFPIKLLFLAIMSTTTSAPAPKAPEPAARPMCDSNGRPLAGNVRTKKAVMECS